MDLRASPLLQEVADSVPLFGQRDYYHFEDDDDYDSSDDDDSDAYDDNKDPAVSLTPRHAEEMDGPPEESPLHMARNPSILVPFRYLF